MKPKIKAGLVACLLLAISCSKENHANRCFPTTPSTDQVLTFTIGQHYGGGIIFYIDSTGKHGLIADTVDLYNDVSIITKARGTAIGTGKNNTKRIIFKEGDSGHYAARRCWNYEKSGYKDWFLPSKDELDELYKQKNVVGAFGVDRPYWTSSEYAINLVWVQYFSNGYHYKRYKDNRYCVRAVRYF